MTRIDSVRAATGSAKDSVLHAAEVVAPYADTAKVRAAHYAQEARVRLAPMVTQAAGQARVQYGARVQPYLEQARTHVPPKVDLAAHQAADRTRKVATRRWNSPAQCSSTRAEVASCAPSRTATSFSNRSRTRCCSVSRNVRYALSTASRLPSVSVGSGIGQCSIAPISSPRRSTASGASLDSVITRSK